MTEQKINPYKITIDQPLAVRLIICSLALLNAVMDMLGLPHLELSSEEVTTFVNVIFLVGSFVWVTWKNNNFTEAAKVGSQVTKDLKENPDITQIDILEDNIEDTNTGAI